MWRVFSWQRHSGARSRAGGLGLLVSRLWGQHAMAPAALRALVGLDVQVETVIPPCLAAKLQSQTRACWPRFPVGELVENLCSLT